METDTMLGALLAMQKREDNRRRPIIETESLILDTGAIWK